MLHSVGPAGASSKTPTRLSSHGLRSPPPAQDDSKLRNTPLGELRAVESHDSADGKAGGNILSSPKSNKGVDLKKRPAGVFKRPSGLNLAKIKSESRNKSKAKAKTIKRPAAKKDDEEEESEDNETEVPEPEESTLVKSKRDQMKSRRWRELLERGLLPQNHKAAYDAAMQKYGGKIASESFESILQRRYRTSSSTYQTGKLSSEL